MNKFQGSFFRAVPNKKRAVFSFWLDSGKYCLMFSMGGGGGNTGQLKPIIQRLRLAVIQLF